MRVCMYVCVYNTYVIVHNGGHKAGTVTLGDMLRPELQLGAQRRGHAMIDVGEETRRIGAL